MQEYYYYRYPDYYASAADKEAKVQQFRAP